MAPGYPLLLLCLLAATRPDPAEGDPTDPTFTSLPVREEMMAKYSNLSLKSCNISVTEKSNVSVEENVILEKPSHVELKCVYTATKDLNLMNVTWKKDDEPLETTGDFNTTKMGNTLTSQYRFIVFNSKQLGKYSCVFGEKELRGTFNIHVPKAHGKKKVVDRLRGGFYCAEVCMSRLSSFKLDLVHG